MKKYIVIVIVLVIVMFLLESIMRALIDPLNDSNYSVKFFFFFILPVFVIIGLIIHFINKGRKEDLEKRIVSLANILYERLEKYMEEMQYKKDNLDSIEIRIYGFLASFMEKRKPLCIYFSELGYMISDKNSEEKIEILANLLVNHLGEEWVLHCYSVVETFTSKDEYIVSKTSDGNLKIRPNSHSTTDRIYKIIRKQQDSRNNDVRSKKITI